MLCSLKRDIKDEGEGQDHGEYEMFCLSSFLSFLCTSCVKVCLGVTNKTSSAFWFSASIRFPEMWNNTAT